MPEIHWGKALTTQYDTSGDSFAPKNVPEPIGASPRVPPSPTPLEMVQGAKGQVPPAVEINFEHIINGEVRTSVDVSGNVVQRGVGGHYTRSGNVRITEVVEAADKNGVVVAKVDIRDPATGKWVPKRANSSMFPSEWSQRQLQIEVEGALRNSKPIGGDLWEGVSPSGLRIQGYYSKPNGGAVTAWPVHGG
jgi:filamentous hemagglutinin